MTSVSLFIIACVLLIILPGPDTAIVTKNTVIGGRKAGMQTMIGSCVGLSLHTIAAVAGLSAIIVKSAFAFTVIKYVGAIYLCYLGVRTLMSMRAKKNQVEEEVLVEAKGNSYFKQGFITNITNPKVAVFFLTFLPQFLAPGADAFWAFFVMGILYTVLTLAWFFIYVVLLDKIRTFINDPNGLGIAALPKDKEIIVMCRSGMRSLETCKKLKKFGYPKVTNVRGGISAYVERGLHE